MWRVETLESSLTVLPHMCYNFSVCSQWSCQVNVLKATNAPVWGLCHCLCIAMSWTSARRWSHFQSSGKVLCFYSESAWPWMAPQAVPPRQFPRCASPGYDSGVRGSTTTAEASPLPFVLFVSSRGRLRILIVEGPSLPEPRPLRTNAKDHG